ncbi:MAG: hypothetical protein ACUVUE_07905 [Candidatus Bathycorpusculaceae bacterium]
MTVPFKTWPISSFKPADKDEQPRLVIGIFQCSKCKAQFRAMMEIEAEVEGKASIKNLVEKIKDVKGELVQTLKTLREKIKTLETERANLMVEIEKLKRVAESRANALENEVAMLREDLKSLKELLGHSEEKEK